MQKPSMHSHSRLAIALMAVASTLPATISTANAGEAAPSYGGGLAEREIIRRQEAVAQADKLLIEGREAYQKGNFQEAVDKFSEARSILPNAPMMADRRAAIDAHLANANVGLGQQLVRQGGKDPAKGGKGTYEDARVLFEEAVAADPGNALARKELAQLDDPIRTNPALDYKHTQTVDEVRRSLYTAEGAYNLGKYDQAMREYERVLRKDPYNTAARRGMETIASAKSAYYRAAYDQTRAELLMEVDKAWEMALPADGPYDDTMGRGPEDVSTGVAYITEKLRRIIIPSVNFEDITVEEAVDFLRQRATELDTLETDIDKKGVNFLIKGDTAPAGVADAGLDAAGAAGGVVGGGSIGAIKIKSLRLSNLPLGQVLKYICEKAKLRYKVDDYAVTLVPMTEAGDEKFTRIFRVPPGFHDALAAGGGEGGAAEPADPFAGDGGGGGGIRARPPIIDLLKKSGIVFGDGTAATLTSGGLLVTNTPAELDKIEQLVKITGTPPRQVKITTKFVEITQENTDELSFDWIVTPFGLSKNTLFGSGGTIGNGMVRTSQDFVNPISGVSIPGIPANPVTPVSNIGTGSLRSGDGAINRNSIDAILNNPLRNAGDANVAPGIAALTGLFSDGQVQLIMRGLAQKKGTDLMTAPSVIAKSAEKGKIEIIREFIYATEYEPPELPNSVGNQGFGGGGVDIGGGGGGGFPVTPATPSAWDTRNTGVTLEVEPVISENDYVINLKILPEIVEFEGFINYGSPIQSPSTDIFGNPVTVVITENRIEMPVFSTRRVDCSLSIYDGYTVAVGGLIREDVQNVEDSVPIFGDLPLIGRLFQSKSENRIKSNLIVFVTAQIIDATGRPLRGNEPTAVAVGDTGVMDPTLLPPPN